MNCGVKGKVIVAFDCHGNKIRLLELKGVKNILTKKPLVNTCHSCIGNETSGWTSIALNFSHQLNPNLAIP